MVWNTIAHPKMMDSEGGDGSFSPIKFADPHKLSFYDVIMTLSGPIGAQAVTTLVKGDFETLKRMIENDEAVCMARFGSAHYGSISAQSRTDFNNVSYESDANVIALVSADPEEGLLYLHSDNTISNSKS